MTELLEEPREGEEPETPPIRSAEERDVDRSTQPYELAALIIGGAVLLITRGILVNQEQVVVIGIATFITLASWVSLEGLQPRLPITILCILSAILGLLFSLPLYFVYQVAWHRMEQFAVLLILINGAGLVGAFLAGILDARRHPYFALIFCFFLLFVIVSFSILLLGRFSFI
jgi:hypothetical protein